MNKPTIGIVLAHPKAILPKYATPGASCFDVFPTHDVRIAPHSSVVVNTGLIFEIPVGWGIKAHSRSGHGFNYDVCLSNSTGIIDSDYTGELKLKLFNHSLNPIEFSAKKAIAQCELHPVYQADFAIKHREDLKITERGANGFGHTDHKPENLK